MFGIGCISILSGVWNWATGPVIDAHDAFQRALEEAKESIRSQAHSASAVGVLGVEVEIQVSHHRYTVVVTGTAVRPFTDESGQTHFGVKYRSPFLCDLSARDFVVLSSAGWYPLDLVGGASYVHAPRRTLGTTMSQSTQNVELTNYTETLYQAREAAMEELQSHITQAGGTGLVDAKVIDRPVYFARHVVEFICLRDRHQDAGQRAHAPANDGRFADGRPGAHLRGQITRLRVARLRGHLAERRPWPGTADGPGATLVAPIELGRPRRRR